MRKLHKVLWIISVSLILTACAGNDGAAEGYKDSIIWALNNDQDTMDPQTNVSNSFLLPQVYASLLTINTDNEVVGDLATAWSVADDNVSWTFTLREDVTFHDGTTFDSADVVATFERLLDEDNPVRYTTQYSYIESVAATSDYEVVIKTKQPQGSFETDMASPNLGILSEETVASIGSDFGTAVSTINGTGPYKVTSWSIGEEMVLEAFDNYYGGEAKTKTITFKVISEQNSREIGLENGEFDIASGISPDAVQRYQDGDAAGVTVSISEGNGMHLFQFNVSKILSDVRLRQAISYGIDREAIVSALFAANGETPATAPVTPSVAGYSDLGVIQQDLDKAKALMAEAGYADGFSITLMTTNVYNKGVEMAEIIKEQLAQINITANIITVERAVFLSSFGITSDQLAYDMFIMGAGGQADAGSALYRVWHTEALSDGVQLNNNNYGFYSNTELDTLLEEGAVTVDRAEADAIYKQAMEIIWETDPVGVFMNFRNNIYGISDNVENFAVSARNTPDMKNIQVGN